MENKVKSLTPVCMVTFRDDEEPRLRRWLADHGYVYRNTDAEDEREVLPDAEKQLPLNRINSIFIWNDMGRKSFSSMPVYMAIMYRNAYYDCVVTVDEFMENMKENDYQAFEQQVAEELLGMYGYDYHDGRNLVKVQEERLYIREEFDKGTSAYDVAIDIGYTCG